MEIPRKSLRSKHPLTGVQLAILTRMEDGWELETVGKEFQPLTMQKGGIGSGGQRINVSCRSIKRLIREDLIRVEEEKPGAFIVTELGHEVLKAYRSDME